MTDELQLFEAQMKYELITIGWIHTHPQFDLFLSSVDLHNQLGYQMQLKEAIAIVHSPIVGKPSFRSFRVKDSQLNSLMNCKLSGFHEHKDAAGSPSWEECSHVSYDQRPIEIKLIDLR